MNSRLGGAITRDVLARRLLSPCNQLAKVLPTLLLAPAVTLARHTRRIRTYKISRPRSGQRWISGLLCARDDDERKDPARLPANEPHHTCRRDAREHFRNRVHTVGKCDPEAEACTDFDCTAPVRIAIQAV